MFWRVLTFLVLLATGMAAQADTFQFNFSGFTANYQGILRTDTFSFQIDTSSLTNGTLTPTVDPRFWELNYIVPATVNGVAVPNLQLSERHIFGPGPEAFYDIIYINSFVNGQWNYYFYSSYPTFLTGGVNEPVIEAGTYALSGENYVPGAPAWGTLVVTDLTPASAPVPEPSSFALVTTALLGVASLSRKRFVD